MTETGCDLETDAHSIVILLLVAALGWPYSAGWGYYPSGGLGLILIVVLLVALLR